MEEILYMFLFTFFSPSLILNSFFHHCYKISCFPQEKMSLLFFLSCSSSLSLWDSLACSATFSFSISKFVDMTILITLSLILYTTRIQKYFLISVFVFIDSLVFSASQDNKDKNNLTFGIGLHEVCTNKQAYATSKSNFLPFIGYQFILGMGCRRVHGSSAKNVYSKIIYWDMEQARLHTVHM